MNSTQHAYTALCFTEKIDHICAYSRNNIHFILVLTWAFTNLTVMFLTQSGIPDYCSYLCMHRTGSMHFFLFPHSVNMDRIVTSSLTLNRWSGMPIFFFLLFEDYLCTKSFGIIVMEKLNNSRNQFHTSIFLYKQATKQ